MARGDFPSAKQDQFVLRFPDGLRDRIKDAAEKNSRSMNAEIVATLSEKYPPAIDQKLKKMIDKAMELDPDELVRVLHDILEKKISSGEITEKDIVDGLIPGVSLRSLPDSE